MDEWNSQQIVNLSHVGSNPAGPASQTKRVKHIEQTGKTCGQCCLAMILDHIYPGYDFDEDSLCSAIGHRSGTRIKDLYEVLDRFDVPHTGKGVPIKDSTLLPAFSILATRYPNWESGGNWHWIVAYRGVIYDPSSMIAMPGKTYQSLYVPSLTTYHEILHP